MPQNQRKIKQIKRALSLLENARAKSFQSGEELMNLLRLLLVSICSVGSIALLNEGLRAQANMGVIKQFNEMWSDCWWKFVTLKRNDQMLRACQDTVISHFDNHYSKSWIFPHTQVRSCEIQDRNNLIGSVFFASNLFFLLLQTVVTLSETIVRENREGFNVLKEEDKQYINLILQKLNHEKITRDNFTEIQQFLKNQSTENNAKLSWFNFFSPNNIKETINQNISSLRKGFGM